MFSWLKNLIENFNFRVEKGDTLKSNPDNKGQIIQGDNNSVNVVRMNEKSMEVGEDNTLIGDIPKGNYGNRNTIIRPGEGGIAIGNGAQAGRRGVSIGTNAGPRS